MLRPLYLALMMSICGLSACIFFIDFMLERRKGNRMKLMTMVTTTMDQPKLWTKALLNQLTIRKSGLARDARQPKAPTRSGLGLTRFSRSTSLGPTNKANRLTAPSETAAPANGVGFSSKGVRTVSLRVASCMAAVAFGRQGTESSAQTGKA